MGDIKELLNIDFSLLFFSLLVVIIAAKTVISAAEWLFHKLGIEFAWMRNKKDDHELLMKTANKLQKIEQKHSEDVMASIHHDEKIEGMISKTVEKIYDSISDVNSKVERFEENRRTDVQQSKDARKLLMDSVSDIQHSNLNRDRQIDALINAQKESLADKINQKYKYYISIGGIPEDEVDEFTNLHMAYKGVGGNHAGDAKYNYVKEHLRVIPVNESLACTRDYLRVGAAAFRATD